MVTARFLRTFAQSSIAVFFAIYLDGLGYSLPEKYRIFLVCQPFHGSF